MLPWSNEKKPTNPVISVYSWRLLLIVKGDMFDDDSSFCIP